MATRERQSRLQKREIDLKIALLQAEIVLFIFALIFIKQYILKLIRHKFMLSFSNAGPKYSFDAGTEDSEIKAPRPKPMESEELPPEFKLEDSDIEYEFPEKLNLGQKERLCFQRRGSLDNHYSILAFIDRKIKEKSRVRIMSQQLHNMRL